MLSYYLDGYLDRVGISCTTYNMYYVNYTPRIRVEKRLVLHASGFRASSHSEASDLAQQAFEDDARLACEGRSDPPLPATEGHRKCPA